MNPDTTAVNYGVRSMTAPLRRVLLRTPATTGDFAGAAWRQPDPALLSDQHERLCELLAGLGCDVAVADPVRDLVDACYVRDPALVTARGAVMLQMRKPIRQAEPHHLAKAFQAAGLPVFARLDGSAQADGGDLVWLDDRTLLVGRSYRTNAEAVRQLGVILAEEGVRVTSLDLPHDRGPGHVLHLMSFYSPVDADLAVVFEPLAPVPLLETLAERAIRLVMVDPDEYATMACNVLAVRPRVAVMVQGNPRTRAALEEEGCEVHIYDGSEISLAGDGGPTCLTAPLWRA